MTSTPKAERYAVSTFRSLYAKKPQIDLTKPIIPPAILFLNRFGKRITTRGIAQQLKNYAAKYGLNEKVVYPHSFRHRFAKNFLEMFYDISLRADLKGHESIENTRIYLRRSSAEQQEIVDKVITW